MMCDPKHVLSSLKNELQKHRVVRQSDILGPVYLWEVTPANLATRLTELPWEG